ncbi:MAG: nuclear transport factor 2 family protein [Ignavibacteriaceae bacterium]|jgi:predicted ester cyclase
MNTKEILVFKAFVKAINEADIAELEKLMSEDHIFIDSVGRKEEGREKMIAGWKTYFDMFPDFKIEIENIIREQEIVGAFGTYNSRRGLVPENIIKMPAAWRAIIRDDKVKLWQVYADWREGIKIIEEDQKSG